MKRWILVGIVFGLIIFGWYASRTWLRFRPAWLEPKFGEVTRGDIRVPITAAGLIEPRRRIDLKSEASGKVEQINVVEGDFVRTGDELVILDPADEERAVTRAEAARTQAKAALEQARIAVEKTKLQRQIAEQRVEELKAATRIAKLEYEEEARLLNPPEGGFVSTSQFRVDTLQARYDTTQAQLAQAELQVQNLLNDIAQAHENVNIQEAAQREAEKNYEEATDRLEETRIVAPSDGIVTDVPVKVGMLVQSGKTGLTGGTVVLTLADITDLLVVTRVDEADYGRVTAVAPPEALPDKPPAELRRVIEPTAGDAPAVDTPPAEVPPAEAGGATNGQASHDAEVEAAPAPAPAARSTPGGGTGRVTLTVDAFPEEKFEGVIERIEPQGRLNQGSSVIQFNVHVRVTDENRYILPLGTQAQVEFTVDHVNGALLVPAEAVKSFEGDRGVWVQGTGAAPPGELPPPRFVACRLGISDGAVTQILGTLDGSELKVGTKVYTKLPSTNDDD